MFLPLSRSHTAAPLWIAAVGMLVVAGGCALAPPAPPPPPAPGVVAALEQNLAASPNDRAAILAVAHAYQLQQRPAEAATLLERAIAAQPAEMEFVLRLGFAYEDLGRLDEALSLYRRYVAEGENRTVRRQLSDRILLVERLQLHSAARDAVAREEELAGTAPVPNTVAIFPFILQAADPRLDPLGVALADLLITDLSQTDRLTVLDRIRIQAMIDEARLAESGLVNPGTAARGGRLLGAGRIVQGSILGTENDLQLRAAVVGVGGEIDGSVSPLETSSRLSRLFEMQKQLALELYRSLGIELTPAERERVLRRPTNNVRALLAYGLGIQAENAGDYRAAFGHYSEAIARDGGFSAARNRAQEVERLAVAGGISTNQIAFGLTVPDPSGLSMMDGMVPPSATRAPSSEVLGQDVVGRRGGVIRIILNP